MSVKKERQSKTRLEGKDKKTLQKKKVCTQVTEIDDDGDRSKEGAKEWEKFFQSCVRGKQEWQKRKEVGRGPAPTAPHPPPWPPSLFHPVGPDTSSMTPIWDCMRNAKGDAKTGYVILVFSKE